MNKREMDEKGTKKRDMGKNDLARDSKTKKKIENNSLTKKESARDNVEAVLFVYGEGAPLEEISQVTGLNPELTLKYLKELQREYKKRDSPLVISDTGGKWKITIQESYNPVVQKVITKTELDKGALETLAVIAYKAPALQSEVIKLRTNKAYDEIKALEGTGYITKEKFGRSYKIYLTQKFFDYFNLPQEKFKALFTEFKEIEKLISLKEEEAHFLSQELEKQKLTEKKRKEMEKQRSEEDILKEVESEDSGDLKQQKVTEEDEKQARISEKQPTPSKENQKEEVQDEVSSAMS